jgi:hypothetical protein
MQDQAQYTESPLYSNHNVRKGISNNKLDSLNYYATKEVFTLSAAFTRRSSITINFAIYLQITTKETKHVRRSKKNCGLLKQERKHVCPHALFTILHPEYA